MPSERGDIFNQGSRYKAKSLITIFIETLNFLNILSIQSYVSETLEVVMDLFPKFFFLSRLTLE